MIAERFVHEFASISFDLPNLELRSNGASRVRSGDSAFLIINCGKLQQTNPFALRKFLTNQ